jgi:hypothetical protein
MTDKQKCPECKGNKFIQYTKQVSEEEYISIQEPCSTCQATGEVEPQNKQVVEAIAKILVNAANGIEYCRNLQDRQTFLSNTSIGLIQILTSLGVIFPKSGEKWALLDEDQTLPLFSTHGQVGFTQQQYSKDMLKAGWKKIKGDSTKLYQCPFWNDCDEDPKESYCAACRPKNKPCEHKASHRYTDSCNGCGILPTCEEIKGEVK